MQELFGGEEFGDEEWMQRARCRNIPEPDWFYVSGAQQHQPKKHCRGCKVRVQCLAYAIRTETDETTFGVWGGMTERERRAIVKRAAVRNLSREALAQTFLDLADNPDWQ